MIQTAISIFTLIALFCLPVSGEEPAQQNQDAWKTIKSWYGEKPKVKVLNGNELS
jgi:hypothetical protein